MLRKHGVGRDWVWDSVRVWDGVSRRRPTTHTVNVAL